MATFEYKLAFSSVYDLIIELIMNIHNVWFLGCSLKRSDDIEEISTESFIDTCVFVTEKVKFYL